MRENCTYGLTRGRAHPTRGVPLYSTKVGFDILCGMRKTRLIENCRCYHLISRLAHQAFFLDDEEKARTVELLRRVEAFSGVIVLAYAIMSNHFHIFIYVPEPEEIDDDELLRRIKVLYRDAALARELGEWACLKDEEAKMREHSRPTGKHVSRFAEYRNRLLRRMWNSSEFMRTFKQHFTMSFNSRRDHHGTMFEGRYHERYHRPDRQVMWKTSAYIDINAWDAGIARRPEDYEWCSFAAAVKGDEKARRGYAFMYGNADDWDAIRECHEKSMREAMDEIRAARKAELAERKAKGEPCPTRQRNPPRSKADPKLKMPKPYAVELDRGNPRIAERILKLLADGPMRPSALRKAVGIRNCTHFNRYYLAPMMEKGIVARTDQAHPQSPQQKYGWHKLLCQCYYVNKF